PLHLLHHSQAARRPRLAPGRRCVARGRAAGRGGREGTTRHFAGYFGLWGRSQICAERRETPCGAVATPRSRARDPPRRRVAAAELDRVGCFRYEGVAGAVANDLAALVPADVKEDRWNRFMARQQATSRRRLKRKVGTRQQIMIDEVGPSVARGRSKADAPEI